MSSLSFASGHGQEGVADVHWGGKVLVRFKRLQMFVKKKSTCIINTEPNSYDDIHGTDDVHGEAPEMHVTTQVNLVGKTLLN